MKKLLSILLAAVLLTVPTFCLAANDITVTVNGSVLVSDVPAQIINERTMVPMRSIFEKLGANVQWIQETQTIIATKGSSIIAMEIGKNDLIISDIITEQTTTVALDVPPQIVDSRTLVPVRAVSEALKMNVEWNNDTRTVVIKNN